MSDDTVFCADCQKFSLQRVKPADAKQGLGHCAYREPFIRHNALTPRECEKFDPADPSVGADRRAWLKGKA